MPNGFTHFFGSEGDVYEVPRVALLAHDQMIAFVGLFQNVQYYINCAGLWYLWDLWFSAML